MTRRAVMAIVAVGLWLAASGGPVSALTEIPFRSIIHETFERRASADPCVVDEVADTLTCPGVGTVQGFGRTTSSILFLSATHPDPATAVRTLTFDDGSTLQIAEDEFISFHTPGNSAEAPGASVSFGNPFTVQVTWVVLGGTGFFEGATGSGLQIVQAAGDETNIRMVGTISIDAAD